MVKYWHAVTILSPIEVLAGTSGKKFCLY